MKSILSTDEFIAAFQKLGSSLDSEDFDMLRAQYSAPNRAVTASILANLIGFSKYQPVNSKYGRLARMIAQCFPDIENKAPDWYARGKKRGKPAWYSFLSAGQRTPNGFLWTMYPELARALEQWGTISNSEFHIADEIESSEEHWEGTRKTITVNMYERNLDARKICITRYGLDCSVCNFNFEDNYGELGINYIHVHHLTPISSIGENYQIDPIEDLRPVCPNCHSMLHRKNPPISIEELRKIIE